MSDVGLDSAGSSGGIRAMWMRGGTSKGGYFLADDLPSDPAVRDRVLMRIMGSPDSRQIDGLGGADPLTSKVAVVWRSQRPGIDVDYLFLQVFVDRPIVADQQNCGNILAGVGAFAIERGLVAGRSPETQVTIFMENTRQIAVATVATPDGRPTYVGDASIDGVPGTASPVPLRFRDTAGSSCGALLPTGNSVDEIGGIAATLIDNGMPCVVMRASDLGVAGDESCAALVENQSLRSRVEAMRLHAGPMMNLGEVADKSVPKMTLVSPPSGGGAMNTRSFIPHKCHDAIGVFAAVSVATAATLPGTPAESVAVMPSGPRKSVDIEHPTGRMTVILDTDSTGTVTSAALLRTARKLFDGFVYAA